MSSRFERRHSSKDSSRRDRESSRRSSPSPVRVRCDNELPSEFGRQPKEPATKENENTVLKRMKTAFTNSPLKALYQSKNDNRKIKPPGLATCQSGPGTRYVVAFGKHWNLVLSEVDKVYLKPKKSKYPYLDANDIPELPPKAPREKKPKTPEEEAGQKVAEEEAGQKVAEEEAGQKVAEEEATQRAASKEPKKIKKTRGRVFCGCGWVTRDWVDCSCGCGC